MQWKGASRYVCREREGRIAEQGNFAKDKPIEDEKNRAAAPARAFVILDRDMIIAM